MNGIFFLHVRLCLRYWIKGLLYWVNNNYLHDSFSSTQCLPYLNIIHNKQSGESVGYGFLKFVTQATSQMVLQNYNGLEMLNVEIFYYLNCFFRHNTFNGVE